MMKVIDIFNNLNDEDPLKIYHRINLILSLITLLIIIYILFKYITLDTEREMIFIKKL